MALVYFGVCDLSPWSPVIRLDMGFHQSFSIFWIICVLCYFKFCIARWAWRHTPLIPTLGRQRQADFWVRGQPGLLSEFQDSQGYTEKPCLGKTKQNNNNNNNNNKPCCFHNIFCFNFSLFLKKVMAFTLVTLNNNSLKYILFTCFDSFE